MTARVFAIAELASLLPLWLYLLIFWFSCRYHKKDGILTFICGLYSVLFAIAP